MAHIVVLGGEILTGKWNTSYLFMDTFPELTIMDGSKFKKLDLNTIKAADLVDQEEIKSIASAAGWGLAAGLVAGVLTGGLGLIVGGVAGAIAKGQKTEVTFSCELEDGRKFLAATDPQTWKKIMGILITPVEKRVQRKALPTEKLESI
ncbi:hypothetical protein [Phormidesmis sp. 146-33]